jgi:hypothetical protein
VLLQQGVDLGLPFGECLDYRFATRGGAAELLGDDVLHLLLTIGCGTGLSSRPMTSAQG